MRRSTLFVCSTEHIPPAERVAIERLIQTAPRGADGRIVIAHVDLVIEAHQYGFFVHTSVVFGDGEPAALSAEFRAVLDHAFAADAS